MAKAKQKGLRLVIELDADEAREFQKLTMTDDTTLYEGIAKSLVLGGGAVVSPEDVSDDINFIDALSEYGLRGDLRAEQDWADRLSFTRDQLESQPMRDVITSWAVYFGTAIKNLKNGLDTPHYDQRAWVTLNALATEMLNGLRKTIATRL